MIRCVQLQGPEVRLDVVLDYEEDEEDMELDDEPIIDTTYLCLGEAARLLAGLEVAMAKALLEAGEGRCLKCGGTRVFCDIPKEWPGTEIVQCACGGVLEPVKANPCER